MKMSLIAVAATVAFTSVAPAFVAPAAAQHRAMHRGHRGHPVCHVQVRHHHRVRVCR